MKVRGDEWSPISLSDRCCTIWSEDRDTKAGETEGEMGKRHSLYPGAMTTWKWQGRGKQLLDSPLNSAFLRLRHVFLIYAHRLQGGRGWVEA